MGEPEVIDQLDQRAIIPHQNTVTMISKQLNFRRKSHPSFIALLLVLLPSARSRSSPPLITEQPGTTTGNEIIFDNRENVVLPCVADADPTPEYNWYRFGLLFDPSGSEGRISILPNTGTLVFTDASKQDEGYYQCNATNKFGTAMSNSAYLRMGILEKFSDKPTRTRVVARKRSVTLTCNPPRGLPQPQVFWTVGASGDLPMTKRITKDPEGNLHITSVEPIDEKGGTAYTCNAFSTRLRTIERGDRQIVKVEDDSGGDAAPELLWGTPINSLVLVGEKLELKCIYSGYPIPEVTWVKSIGAPLPPDRVSRESYEQELNIRNVQVTDEGTYQCTASNAAGAPQTHTVVVKVQSKPTFLEQTVNLFYNRIESEGSRVELPCQATGNPTPTVEIFMNGIPIGNAAPNARRKVKDGVITIERLRESDTAVFQCNASNTHGYVYRNAYINVMDAKPEWRTKPQDVKVVADKEAIIHCETFGAPVPTITWIRGGQALTGGRYEIMTFPRGSLKIRKVAFSDAGIYTCKARNQFGEILASARLEVHKKTVIMSMPQDAEKTAGTEATFRCTAVSDESNPLEILWKKNGSPMDVDTSSGRVYRNPIDNSLVISGLQDTDSATYTCVARTPLDEATHEADLIVQDVPNKVNQPVVESCGQRSSRITWVPNGDNRAPILTYVLQSSTSFEKGSWTDIGGEMPANRQSAEVVLSPWANYTFRVVARNKIGNSIPSTPSKICTTPENSPDKNPANVKGEGSIRTNMIISWSKMPKIDQNGLGFYYQIRYKRTGTQNFISEDIRGNPDITTFKVDNTEVYVAYDIQVVAWNSQGQSSAQIQTYTGFSGEDKPTEAPKDFSCNNAGLAPTQVQCGWTKVKRATLNGDLLGYAIVFWVDGESEQQKQEVEIKGDQSVGMVDILRPYSKIRLYTVVRNNKYSSEKSNEVIIETPEGRPGPVQKLRVIPVGSNSLELNWDLPLMPNGVIRGYRVYFREVNGLILGQEVLGKEIASNLTKKTILSGLKQSTMYRVKVNAFSYVGEGEINFVEDRTTVSGKPDTPNLEVSHIGDNFVNITIVKANTNNPGSVFYAQYKLTMDATWISTSEQREMMWIYIDSLTSGAQYDVRIIAKNGNTLTEESPAKSFMTTGDGSGSMAASGWIIGLVIMLLLIAVIIVIAAFVKKRQSKHIPNNPWISNGEGSEAFTDDANRQSDVDEDDVFVEGRRRPSLHSQPL